MKTFKEQFRPNLKYAGTVRRSPCVQHRILARGHEPLARVGELEREHAALVQTKLILLRFCVVQDLHEAVFQPEHQERTG